MTTVYHITHIVIIYSDNAYLATIYPVVHTVITYADNADMDIECMCISMFMNCVFACFCHVFACLCIVYLHVYIM